MGQPAPAPHTPQPGYPLPAGYVDTDIAVISTSDELVIDLTSDEAVIDLTRLPGPPAGDGFNPHTPGYHRTEEECRELERRIISLIPADAVPASGVVMMSIDGASPLVDLSRTREMQLGWGDLPTYMHGYEAAATNMMLVDFRRPDGPAIVMAGRLVDGSLTPPTSSGSQVIDSLSDRISADEVVRWLGRTTLRDCWDVTTFYTVTDLARSERFPFGYAPLGYVGLCRYAFWKTVPLFFSYVNDATMRSFERVGITWRDVADRELRAPLVDGWEYNSSFKAVVQSIIDLSLPLFDPDHVFNPIVETYRAMDLPTVVVESVTSGRPAG